MYLVQIIGLVTDYDYDVTCFNRQKAHPNLRSCINSKMRGVPTVSNLMSLDEPHFLLIADTIKKSVCWAGDLNFATKSNLDYMYMYHVKH